MWKTDLDLIDLAPNAGTARRRVRCRESNKQRLGMVWPGASLLLDDESLDETACQRAFHGLHTLGLAGTITSTAGDPDILRVAQMMQAVATTGNSERRAAFCQKTLCGDSIKHSQKFKQC